MPYTSLCLCSSYQTPSPGARLPWAMTPCINRVIAACSHAGGVPFSSLSPFLFRYILSCLQSSFSIKKRPTGTAHSPVEEELSQQLQYRCSFYAPMSSPPGSHPRGPRLPRLAEPRSPARSRSSVRRSLSSPLSPSSAAVGVTFSRHPLCSP